MKQLLARATELANENRTSLNTGHLLIAMIQGDGTAAKLLKLRGLTEGKVKNHLGGLDAEPPDVLGSVVDKATQIAKPFRVQEPSPLHLLAAMAGYGGSHSQETLKSFGLDAMSIRTQALRCLTGVTEERGADNRRTAMPALGRGDALPLDNALQSLASKPTAPQIPSVELAGTAKPPVDSQPALSGARARQLIEMGRELERKQRKKRVTQSTSQSTPQSTLQSTPQSTPRPIITAPVDDEPFAEAVSIVEPPPVRDEIRGWELPPVAEFELLPNRYPMLSSAGRNLSNEAHRGELDEIIGRLREMERMADVLNKRRANSPCLVGPAGVGKTALVEGLALKLCRGEAPGLENQIVIEIRPTDLLSGTSVRGALSERLATLREEVADSEGRVILFFDEIHALLSSSDGADAVQELKTALSRGELPCIAATTNEDYVRYIEADPALARRFTPVEVNEPSLEEAIQILEGVEPAYRAHHGVEFSADALSAAVRLSARYVNGRALPDKAIALLDLAGARSKRAEAEKVEAGDVAHVLAEQLDIPAERLAASDSERLLKLEDELAESIVGHGHVLAALGETLRRNAAGFRTGRPIGSFLFLGPTGVGKTETAKALAEFLFPGGTAMVRLDMSEFSEAHAVARLIGAPPGYVGHEEGGQLTQAVRRRPYCLVLLDEVEKAHPDVLKVLLQVLDDGRLTDGLGRTVAFENTVIVMTSNLGSDVRPHRRHVGFGTARETEEIPDLTETILAAVREVLPPELWNRIDEPLVFRPLTRGEVSEIAALMLSRISIHLREEQGVELEIGPGAVGALVQAGGYDQDLGARPMRRTIQRLVEGPVARMVLSDEARSGDLVTISGTGTELSFEVTRTTR